MRSSTRSAKASAFALAALAGACALSPAASAERLVFAHTLTTDHPYHQMAVRFRDELAARAPGLVVEIHPDSALGGEGAVLDKVRAGEIDITTVTSAVTANTIPAFSVLSLPFLFRDTDHLFTVMDSAVGEALAGELRAHGLVKLGYAYGGSRGVYSRKPIRGLADLAGQRLRVIESPVIADAWAALGATPVPIAWDLFPERLAAGEVDGAEGSGVSYLAKEFYRHAPFFSRIEYVLSWHNFVMSAARFEALTPDQRQAVLAAAAAAEAHERAVAVEAERRLIEELAARGVEVVVPADLPAWRARVARVHAAAALVGGDGLVEQIGRAGAPAAQ
jgi:TRAP-type C4-dicarboxylate transport system substrate-binding protein